MRAPQALQITMLFIVLTIVIAEPAGHARAEDPIPDCNEKVPDYEGGGWCGGFIQHTCPMAQTQEACTGRRKEREQVTQDCIAAECWWHCYQAEILCWVEYECVWNQQESKCENGTMTDYAMIQAKTYTDNCARDAGCNPGY